MPAAVSITGFSFVYSHVYRAATEYGMPLVQYDNKLCQFMDDYDRAFIVHADNVGSKQFQEIRRVCSADSIVLPPSPAYHSS